MGEKLIKAMDEYEKVFGDNFPSLCFTCYTDDKIIEIIEGCIATNKDVYESGYLTLDDNILY